MDHTDLIALVLMYMAGGELLFAIYALEDIVVHEPNFINRFNWLFGVQSILGICCICCSVLTHWQTRVRSVVLLESFEKFCFVYTKKRATMGWSSY